MNIWIFLNLFSLHAVPLADIHFLALPWSYLIFGLSSSQELRSACWSSLLVRSFRNGNISVCLCQNTFLTSDICIFSKAMQKYKEDFDQRTWIIYFECTWGECGCGCCVWAVVCQMRLVWFLCKNILSRSVCQEVRWCHWPMRGGCGEVAANQRRERAVFALRWDVWSKSRIIWVSETLSEVLSSSSTCDISWHILNLCHHKVFFASMTHLFSTEYDQDNY